MKKGFTLIELLAVIAILATVLLISVPKITNVIENVKQKNYDNQVLMIKGSVEKYLSSDTEMIPKNPGDSINVTLQDLVNDGIFKTIPLDPRSGEALPSDSYVTVTRTENGLAYEYLTAEEPIEPAGGIWTFEVTIPAGGDTFSFGVADANLTINWGDSSETTHSYIGDDYISHVYAEGVYDVTLDGTTSHITFCNFLPAACVAPVTYVTAITTVVPIGLGLTNADLMFKNAESLNSIIPNFFDVASANITSAAYMFYYATGFNEDISGWDTSKVTDMSYMFSYLAGFNQDIGSWDTSSVTNMSNMLARCYDFNQPIGAWDTSKVTDMSEMFKSNDVFNQPIGAWDTSSVIDMNNMFYSADGFNQDISSWDTSNVTDMSYMFKYNDIFDQNISGWNVSKVTNMDSMFYSDDAFNQDLSSWCVSNISALPNGFDAGTTSWVLPKPIWGTCP